MISKQEFKNRIVLLSEVKLDIGCGPNKKEGYLGIDILPMEGVDLVINLDVEGLPLEDGTVDEIYTSHFLEHVENTSNVIKELGRVLKHKGRLIIIVPHYTNPYAFHFTHKSYWSSYSLNQEYIDYYIKTELVLKERKIKIVSLPFIDPIFNFFANRFINVYERFFSSFVKAWEVEFVLEKDNEKKDFFTIR